MGNLRGGGIERGSWGTQEQGSLDIVAKDPTVRPPSVPAG